MKNAGFVERLFHFKLPVLALLTNVHFWANVSVVRRKGKDCVANDALYVETVFNYCMTHRTYYQKLAQLMFVAASLSPEQIDQNQYQLIGKI